MHVTSGHRRKWSLIHNKLLRINNRFPPRRKHWASPVLFNHLHSIINNHTKTLLFYLTLYEFWLLQKVVYIVVLMSARYVWATLLEWGCHLIDYNNGCHQHCCCFQHFTSSLPAWLLSCVMTVESKLVLLSYRFVLLEQILYNYNRTHLINPGHWHSMQQNQ